MLHSGIDKSYVHGLGFTRSKDNNSWEIGIVEESYWKEVVEGGKGSANEDSNASRQELPDWKLGDFWPGTGGRFLNFPASTMIYN